MKIAAARARTQSGATFCITVLISDILSSTRASKTQDYAQQGDGLNVAVAHKAAAKTVVPWQHSIH